MRGNPVLVQSTAAAKNGADAAELWKQSEGLTGASYLN